VPPPLNEHQAQFVKNISDLIISVDPAQGEDKTVIGGKMVIKKLKERPPGGSSGLVFDDKFTRLYEEANAEPAFKEIPFEVWELPAKSYRPLPSRRPMKLGIGFDGLLHADLSSGQYSQYGKILHHLYYSHKYLMDMAPGRSGYPHNGGEHTLRVKGSKEDIVAWLEMVRDEYARISKLPEGVAEVQKAIDEVKAFKK
jgi:hypothetical protein